MSFESTRPTCTTRIFSAVQPDEYALIRRAASEGGMSISAYLRVVAVSEARRLLGLNGGR